MQTGAWTRATDSDTDPELRGFIITISQGTFAGYKYINTNQTAITVNTTAITYSEFSNLSETDPVFVSWRDQARTANAVFIAPNGSNGVATWRALVSEDIPNLAWSKITSGTPTTIGGYGITDAYTKTEVDTSLGLKENTITAGTTSQYWRGDKTWQTLDKSVIGLGNVKYRTKYLGRFY